MSTWTLAVSTLITADRRIEGFLQRNAEKLSAFDEVLIVCQGVEKAPEFAPGLMPPNGRIVICERRGISASRNAAIAALATDIVWFMDDDTILSNDLAAIKQAIIDSPAEINTLRIQDCDSENLFKAYPPEGDIGSLGLLRVSSIEITCKRSMFERTQVRFPEWIGIGTPLPGGEENLFLRESLRAGVKVRHLAKIGCRHPVLAAELKSIWARPNRMRSMGIVARDCGAIGVLLCVRWSIRGARAGVPKGRIAELWSGFMEGPGRWRTAEARS